MKRFCYETQYNVITAGGGVSGITAATAAGRMDAKVLIVEQSGYLGGASAGYGVRPIVTFHTGEKQVIRGITKEIVERLKNDGCSTGHIYGTVQYINYPTPLNVEGSEVILDRMMGGADCQVLFHAFIGGAEYEGGKITGLMVCNKDGIHKLKVTVYIDGIGDGGVALFVGAPMTKGRESGGAAQPMTMSIKYVNAGTAVIKNHIQNHIEDFSRHQDNEELMDTVSRFSFYESQEEFRAAEARSEPKIKREGVLCSETDRSGEHTVNTIRIIEHDAVNAVSLSDAKAVGQRQCRQPDRSLRNHVPGFEHALLEFTGPSMGVRGPRQLSGKYTLTAEDISKHREFDSAITHSAYPIDTHNPKGLGTDSRFLSGKGTYYDIPYGTLYCEDTTSLPAAGRYIFASFETQAATRATPTAGTLGRMAGVAAALTAQAARNAAGTGARCHGEVAKVGVKELQRYLMAQDTFFSLKE